MAYASPQDFIDRYDVRVVGDLASVDGTQVSQVGLLTNARLLQCLEDAEGEINSAVLVGQRYSTTDLAAMTGADAAHLQRICCEIAWYLLLSRRWYVVSGEHLKLAVEKYADHLEMLRAGKRVFNIVDVKEAGLPTMSQPSSVQINNLNTIAARSRGHFYPDRVMPVGRN